MTAYTLPDLPYDYGALEPHISGQIMELHHGKHHAAYVRGANEALEQIAEAREEGSYATLTGLEKTLAFNVSGHLLHTLYWQNMSPDGGGRPDGGLAEAITEHFGSFEGFHGQLTAATVGVQGSGWGVLCWEPAGRRLIVEQVYDHHGNVAQGTVPLLAFDAWEHAYYLQYRNVRPDFVRAMWEVVNWDDVAARYAAAAAMPLGG
jgi:Fe-Mn family superoxide dismutase